MPAILSSNPKKISVFIKNGQVYEGSIYSNDKPNVLARTPVSDRLAEGAEGEKEENK